MYYVNCRHCVSIGSEKLCSSCSLEGEHKDLPNLKTEEPTKRPKSAKMKFIEACVAKVNRLKDEEFEY